ncbi:hypothetical protein AVEN_54564-1 [Araneus ventricosus]|uniref:Uncharacterized protein n=1 Tax=Araneus ventricosus TaxID=182803 RepID=A0A4Y2BNA2_ARAVE|nr:hypothetical protein AVEN_54564-1 [Araneus ventricosus]
MVIASEIPLLDTLLEQQRIVVARGFLGLLEHSEKILVNDGWKSQYSSLWVFLIVCIGHGIQTESDYIPEIYPQRRRWITKGTGLQTDECIC